MIKNNGNSKNINLGLQLLRFILSFWVVMHHCCNNVNNFKGRFHIPTFMIMSFYFFYYSISKKNIDKIKGRFERIIIPYIVWPLLIFLFNNILFHFFGISRFNKKLLLKDLIIQIIIGLNYHSIFYFQFNLIFLTLVFTILSFSFKKVLFIFHILFGISYLFQYSYINVQFFKEYPWIISSSLGEIFEFLPFAVTGFTFGFLNLIIKIKLHKGKVIIYNIILMYFLIKFEIFSKINGFSYPGFFLNIGGSILFILFSVINFENNKIKLLIRIITSFTGGVYYIHMIVFDYLKARILLIKNRTIYGCLIIYIICYFICLIGKKIFYKTKLLYLFY